MTLLGAPGGDDVAPALPAGVRSAVAPAGATAGGQARLLLVAVIGVWIGFLGMMAVIVVDGGSARAPGAVALAGGLAVAIAFLRSAVGARARKATPAECSPLRNLSVTTVVDGPGSVVSGFHDDAPRRTR